MEERKRIVKTTTKHTSYRKTRLFFSKKKDKTTTASLPKLLHAEKPRVTALIASVAFEARVERWKNGLSRDEIGLKALFVLDFVRIVCLQPIGIPTNEIQKETTKNKADNKWWARGRRKGKKTKTNFCCMLFYPQAIY